MLIALLIIGAGLFAVFFPDAAFFFEEGWKYRNVEPSNLYLFLIRIGGGIGVVVGVLMLFGVIKPDGTKAATKAPISIVVPATDHSLVMSAFEFAYRGS